MSLISEKLIISCNRYLGEAGPWFGPEVTDRTVRWVSFDDRPVYFWERIVRKPNLAMLRTALQAVWTARRERAELLFLTDAGAAAWWAWYPWSFGPKFRIALLPSIIQIRRPV